MTVTVRGRVQGVGFRWWTRARALELGLVGHARNTERRTGRGRRPGSARRRRRDSSRLLREDPSSDRATRRGRRRSRPRSRAPRARTSPASSRGDGAAGPATPAYRVVGRGGPGRAWRSYDGAMSDVPPELARLRSSIDNIDAALVHLLAERFKCTQQVGELKAARGSAARRPRARGAPDHPAAGAGRRERPRPGVRGEVHQLRHRRGHPPPRVDRQRLIRPAGDLVAGRSPEVPPATAVTGNAGAPLQVRGGAADPPVQ